MNKFSCFLFLLSIFLLSGLSFAQREKFAEARLLEIGERIEREISGDQVHCYKFRLRSGGLVNIDVQNETNAWTRVEIYKTDGFKIQEYVWPPTGERSAVFTTGTSPFSIIAEPATDYFLKLSSSSASRQTRYALHLKTLAASQYKAELKRNEAVKRWLWRQAIPLKTVSGGNGFQDLMPLKRILQNVRVVGLGEATHGSREFFQFKHRMLEFLVKEVGFTVFGIESGYAASTRINDYILSGRGNRDAVLAGQGFWQWDTEEVAEMIEWMREYNRSAPDGRKVKFYGFDFQVNDLAVDAVMDFLQKAAPERVEHAAAALKPLKAVNVERPAFARFFTLKPDEKALILAQVNELFNYLNANKGALIERTSVPEFEEALRHAHLLTQFTDSYIRTTYEQDNPESGVATRARYMAENIERILHDEGENTRMVVWTHNEHINKTPYRMGYYLQKAFGSDYYAFGFSFNRGSFQALEIAPGTTPAVKEFSFTPAFQGSVGWHFNKIGKPYFAVDLRQAPRTGLVAEWLARPRAMRSIGNGFAPGNPAGYYREPLVLKTAYDGIIYIEDTTRARPNNAR